ncbi:mannitol-1-phosphate/altronate dehydrogenase [Aulographum hederae CBS 113979]|uniref:Mannitol-1-phosphate 5-dehydrogenase n=1 Tax=Aulographum hederae CBS 113979 TaxID=1176131 RepID=A0A6G1H3D6_9PEZI|nr:mannitol-1-phosphate/altronate dehydrogenase [Aulographum hederae CBS 113979]
MSYEKKAIHFGGGNIGRGFVAEFLHNSGYEVVFVDVMDSIIEALQKTPSYTVTEIGEDGERTFTIDHYRAINSKYEEAKVIDEIATADTVTCAVGPNILKFIAPVIAKGIEARRLDYPLAVIACENMIGATDALAEFIKAKLGEDTIKALDTKVRYANSAIDRIVPNQSGNANPLDVKIEKFYEWCVEETPFNGAKKPAIEGVHYVTALKPYIERKLFTVNTSHATAAYYGYARGKKLVHEAMHDKEIHDIVRSAVKETANLIVKSHGIEASEQNDYVEKIIARISNPALEDEVVRVGRAPLRKLGRKERFIGPASQLAEMGEPVDALLGAAEQAFRFQNVEGDEESATLAGMLKELDADAATQKICGLEKDHPLYSRVVEIVKKVQGGN